MTNGREEWDFHDYVDKMNSLYDLKGTMEENQWQALFVAIRSEMMAKFPEEEVKDLYM